MTIGDPVANIFAFALAAHFEWPPFYKQERIGKNGEPLHIKKITTLPECVPAVPGLADEMAGDMPRVCVAIRHYGINELPQLHAIREGEMSFVGPRPILPADRDLMRRSVGAKKEEMWFEEIFKPQLPGCLSSFVIEKRAFPDMNEREAYNLKYELDIKDFEQASPAHDRTIVARAVAVALSLRTNSVEVRKSPAV